MKPTLLLAGAFLVLHALVPVLVPAHASSAASYLFIVLAPALAMLTALQRARHAGFSPAAGWSLAAAAMLLWTLGAAASARQELWLGNADLTPRDSMLLYVLFGVPLAWAIASVWGQREARMVRAIDAVLATTLGVLFFVYTWALGSAGELATDAQLKLMVWMFDAENAFLFLGVLVRWHAADSPEERNFFSAMSGYLGLYLAAAVLNNHWITVNPDPQLGFSLDVVSSAPFMLFIVLARRVPAAGATFRRPPRRRVQYAQSASPLCMAIALLLLGLVLVKTRYEVGCAGILIAVLGYGLRSTLSELRHIETVDGLRDDQRSLEALAWNDALTGVANRRAFDAALDRESRRAGRGHHVLSLLMIDIDEFKRLNDHYGHVVGDQCLRRVARELQQLVQRPADLLARYGGEEFVVLLADTERQGATQLAQILCKAVEAMQLENVDSKAGIVTISVGVASATPVGEMSPAGLIQAADAALYRAKQAGRNRVMQEAVPA
jgi:diguanylate cyclase (GGDEF)-like protein